MQGRAVVRRGVPRVGWGGGCTLFAIIRFNSRFSAPPCATVLAKLHFLHLFAMQIYLLTEPTAAAAANEHACARKDMFMLFINRFRTHTLTVHSHMRSRVAVAEIRAALSVGFFGCSIPFFGLTK